MNPQPPVLETGALPVELLPSDGHRPPPKRRCGRASARWFDHQTDECTGSTRRWSNRGAGLRWCQDESMTTSASAGVASGAGSARSPGPYLCPNRCDHGIGDPGRRRQSQGPQSGRAAGRRLRRWRAGLSDTGLHRRRRRRGMPRSPQPPVHPRRGPAGTQRSDRGQDRARLRVPGRRRERAGDERRKTGGL